jgi:site-specific DNA-methyltransferase (adenine-specific)
VTLAWRGRGRVHAGPRTEGADAKVVHAVAEGGASRLVRGDNLATLTELAASEPETVTLAYLDPPFFTNRVHEAVARGGGFLGPERPRAEAFDDRWDDLAAYLQALAARVVQVRTLLAPWGCAVIHVDPRTSHYVKVLADEIFGTAAFASEIVWRYRRWPSKTPNFQRVHDVLLRYRKDPSAPPRFNAQYEPLAASTVATWGTTKQQAVFEKGGRRARSSRTPVASRGAPMGDVWEIGVIAPVARERTGYPSQKPEALLARLVDALTDPGDLVLDPYMGSGTSVVVAHKRGRRFLGIDKSEIGFATARARLEAAGATFGARSRMRSAKTAGLGYT